MNSYQVTVALAFVLLTTICPRVNAEAFLHTFAPAIDSRNYPKIEFELVVNDHAEIQTIAGKDKCHGFYNERCYSFELTENDKPVKGLKYRHIRSISDNTEILYVQYITNLKRDSDITLHIKIDNDSIHNGEGDTFRFESNSTPHVDTSMASNFYLNKYYKNEEIKADPVNNYSDKMDSLVDRIAYLEESTSDNLNKISYLTKDKKALQRKVDRLEHDQMLIASISEQKQNHYKSQGYEVGSNTSNIPVGRWISDEFWYRASLFSSTNSNDEFSQVRVDTSGSVPRFIFLRRFKKEAEYYAQVVEYDTDFYVIDEYKLNEDDLNGAWVAGAAGIFRQKNFDNLWISDGTLYYYTSYNQKTTNIKSYKLGSRDKNKAIGDNLDKWKNEKPRYALGNIYQVLQSPNKNLTASIVDGNLSLYWGSNTYIQSKQPKEERPFTKPLIDADKTVKLTDISNLKSGCSFMVGAVAWSDDSQSLFFDNSGICSACIYEIDIDTNKVTKIIPEHEAENPYIFEWNGHQYMAYVEMNKIKIARRNY